MGASRKFRPLLLATVSLLALGLASPALAVIVPPPPGGGTGICTGSTFAGGLADSAAIAGGQLWMWGLDQTGNLGQAFPGLVSFPRPVVGLSSISNVYLGTVTSYAVDTSGDLWGWGDNFYSELGQPSPPGPLRTPTPTLIDGPRNVVQVANAETHTLAVTSDGTLWGWGSSTKGELNVISSTPVVTPQVIPGMTNVAKVAVGDSYSVILRSDGTVYGGGSNSVGQLGLGTTPSSLFTQIPGLSNIVDIAVGPFGGDPFLVALDSLGHVFFTGLHYHGEMGFGTSHTMTPQLTVVQIPGLDSITAISAGAFHVLALRGDGSVQAWGDNDQAQLGRGTTGSDYVTPAPVHFLPGTNIVSVAAGQWHSMALDDHGGLWTWGDDAFQEVGDGIGGEIILPFHVRLAAVPAPTCNPLATQSYVPSRDGYGFNNSGPNSDGSFDAPTYDKMQVYYPKSSGLMYHGNGSHSRVGDWFYNNWFAPAYKGGLCYGMATSDTFLFNRSSIDPGTFARWNGFFDAFDSQQLTPPFASDDATVIDFVERYHARMYGALGFDSSVAVWTKYDVLGNIAAFNDIAAQVRNAPQVVAFGPKGSIELTDSARFKTLFNNSHAVVAYSTEIESDGTRVINVYDPSSVTSQNGSLVTDRSRIEVDKNGSVVLKDYVNGADSTGGPTVWIGGGIDKTPGKRDMGQPGDWVLMPLPDRAFGDQAVAGLDNQHWFLTNGEVWLVEHWNIPVVFPPGLPIFRFSGPQEGWLGMRLNQGAAYNESLTAQRVGAMTSTMSDGHLVTVTQTDSTAIGSSHHLAINSSGTSINLDAASQAETFNLEIAADYLPAYSRDISMTGVPLNVSQSLNVASDAQTAGLTINFSGGTSITVPTTFEQDGANAGKTTVPVVVPANSLPSTVSVFDWNALPTSLIFEVIDAQGSPTGVILQGNPTQLAAQVSTDLAGLQTTIAGITDKGLQESLAAKVAAAQDSFARGQDKAAANVIEALRHEISAQAGKALDAATATKLRSFSAEALVLLEA